MILVFSGYNQRAIITFFRCLEDNYVENYCILASSEEDPILRTKYKEKVLAVRKKKELDKDEIFQIIDKIYSLKKDKILIVPSTEYLNRFCLKYRLEFEKKNCIIPLVDKEMYEMISDKEKFWKYCKEEKLKIPENININDTFSEKYVAKPKCYISPNGQIYSPIIVQNKEEHNSFLAKKICDYFDYQEFISGRSMYLLYYFAKNGRVWTYSQENYMQQVGGKSIIAAEGNELYKSSISKKYASLFQKINYHGFVMIEIRESNNEYYMIEANPRFWGPSQLFYDAGIPLFEAFLWEYHYLEKVPNKRMKEKTKYWWSGGFGKMLDEKKVVWHGDGKKYVNTHLTEFEEANIYRRDDTMEIYNEEKRSEV